MTADQLDITTLQAELERHGRELDRLRIIAIVARRARWQLSRTLEDIWINLPQPASTTTSSPRARRYLGRGSATGARYSTTPTPRSTE